MKIALIGCPFRTTYGHYISSLRAGLQRADEGPVEWVAANCGCGDPVELSRTFQVDDCNYFEMRTKIGGLGFVGYSPNKLKQGLKLGIRYASNYVRAARYASRTTDAEVIHFHQTLYSYGADVVVHFLKRHMKAARVFTVHELDPEQLAYPTLNKIYNRADAVIVHDTLMKEKLVSLGVAADLVHVVCCGTDLAEGENVARDGIVFYGGHHFNKSKGADILLKAYAP